MKSDFSTANPACHNLVGSMSAVGSYADNAAMEGFFGLLKRDRVNRRRYLTRSEARADVFDYIERFHNPRMKRRIERRAQQEEVPNSTVRVAGG